jgi:hypothetical protein
LKEPPFSNVLIVGLCADMPGQFVAAASVGGECEWPFGWNRNVTGQNGWQALKRTERTSDENPERDETARGRGAQEGILEAHWRARQQRGGSARRREAPD